MSNSTAATCLTPNDWSYNSLGQSPCTVASALAGVCVGEFTLSPLAPDYVYLGPSVANANSCRCSSVYYSLLSACANCQGRNFLRWSAYDGNCSTVYLSVFPQPLPTGTVVPHYAYLNVQTTDTFNVSLAQTAGGAESSPVATVASNTATGSKTATKSSTVSPTKSGSAAKSGPNVGAIAGGVIGGVVILALIAGFIFWLIRRNNRNKAPPASQMYYGPDTASSPPPMSFGGTSTYSAMPTPKVYDPSDPSTYPSQGPPTTYTPPLHNNVTPNYTGVSQNTFVASPGPRYTGVPEL
ncbi:uncharacterized protein LACBIDRAFT_306125 [Laccaria bicolor S238N-H82]|uniref:Predicted protein n=1 Tax=Laccaria bicolor (strain S238N-H82 / ATCC MYA-4686) TaxID=486041 RepID=B0CST1_LACBS|nr:uncharacterized protein LACBIDRAFT_306125 [Laccaria bicolor S238N-H82]EDR14361.1 predicted protein [Laccaria bicolor S238N-H82]|eukprot:XP_001874920.1 predicted protein [Laccaria bicolor S238N-H82]